MNLDAANTQLDRVLAFFPRVDAKSSALFAIDTGIIGVAAVNFRPTDLTVWYIALPAITGLGLTFLSLVQVYRCMFPHLDGGEKSLVYFREIAGRTEANYLQEFKAQTDAQQLNDLLGQIWRNSAILRIKFDAIRNAFVLAAVSLAPWAWFLVSASMSHARMPIVP